MRKRFIFLSCTLLLAVVAITGCQKKEIVRTVAWEQSGVEFKEDVIQLSNNTDFRENYKFTFPKTEETSKISEGTGFQCDSLQRKFYALDVNKGLFKIKVEADELQDSMSRPDLVLSSDVKFKHKIEVVLEKNEETKDIKKNKVFVLPEMKACYRAEKVKKDKDLLKVKASELSDMELMSVIYSFSTGEV